MKMPLRIAAPIQVKKTPSKPTKPLVEERQNLNTLSGQTLIKFLKQADHIYFNTTEELLVTDDEYDILYAKAKKQLPSDPYFKTVGAPQVSRDKVQLPIKMPGLPKFTPESIAPFISNSGKSLVGQSLIWDKIDGISVLLTYFNGKLVKAYSRGDDSEGRDITLHVQKIPSIPLDLEYFDGINCCSGALTGGFAVRGELSIPRKTFDQLKKAGKLITNKGKSTQNEYKSPRAMTVGLINAQDSSDLLQYSVFSAFSIEASTISLTLLEATLELENLFDWTARHKVVSTDSLLDKSAVTKIVTDFKTTSDFECDGIVVAIDAANIGMHKGGRFAVKLAAIDQARLNGERTTVIDVEVTMSARNLAKPRIIIEPVTIDGFTIDSITGNNMREINTYKIGPGSQVTVVRAGDVIPHIVKPEGKDDPDRITPSSKHTSLLKCPDCKHTLKWTYTQKGVQGADLHCNDELCLKSKLAVEFFIKLGAKDVGEANLLNVIRNADNDIDVAGMLADEKLFTVLGKDLGPKTYNSLHDAMICDHARVMYASCVFSTPTVSLGEESLRKFIAELPITIDDLLEMNDAQIDQALQGFHGTEMRRIFKARMPIFAAFYDTIYDYHNPPKTTDVWRERVYTFTGFRDDDAKKQIAIRGGSYSESMTSKVTHLVYASGSGTKYDTAVKRKIVMLTPHEFEQSFLE